MAGANEAAQQADPSASPTLAQLDPERPDPLPSGKLAAEPELMSWSSAGSYWV